MFEEHYKPIDGYPQYEISNLGNVRHVWKTVTKPLKPFLRRDYYTVRLGLNGEQKNHKIHRLILQHFGPPMPEGKTLALHRDDDKTHNCLQNLIWGDKVDNGQMAVLNGKLSNEHSLKTFLTKEEGRAAKAAVEAGESMSKVAKRFGCSRWTVSNIVHNKIKKFL